MRLGTEGYIYQRGSSPNTRVAISQKNRVFSKPYTIGSAVESQVGVLSTFDYSDSRGLDPVRGIGFGDQIAELVPGVTEPMDLTLNRTLMYTAGIVQELGYRGGIDGLVRSLRQHKWPFDIRSELAFSELVSYYDKGAYASGVTPVIESGVGNLPGQNYCLITYFWTCWLKSVGLSFPSDSAIVAEDASASATDVTDGSTPYGNDANHYGDLLDSGNNPTLGTNAGSQLFAQTV